MSGVYGVINLLKKANTWIEEQVFSSKATFNDGVEINGNALITKNGTIYCIVEDSSAGTDQKKTALRMHAGGGQLRLLNDDSTNGDALIAWNRTGSTVDLLLLPVGKTHFHSNGSQMVASGGTNTIGSLVFAKYTGGGTHGHGDIISGADLEAGFSYASGAGGALSGTYRACGAGSNAFNSMYQRVT